MTNGCEAYENEEYLESNLRHEIKEEPLSEDEMPTDLPMNCMLCLKQFQTVLGLRAHVLAKHNYKSVKRKADGSDTSTSKTYPGTVKYVCDICKRNFTTSTDLKVHEVCHDKISCFACNAKFNTFKEVAVHRRRCQVKNELLVKPKTLTDILKERVAKKQEAERTQQDEFSEYIQCPECMLSFKDMYHYKYHNEKEHPITVRDSVKDNSGQIFEMNIDLKHEFNQEAQDRPVKKEIDYKRIETELESIFQNENENPCANVVVIKKERNTDSDGTLEENLSQRSEENSLEDILGKKTASKKKTLELPKITEIKQEPIETTNDCITYSEIDKAALTNETIVMETNILDKNDPITGDKGLNKSDDKPVLENVLSKSSKNNNDNVDKSVIEHKEKTNNANACNDLTLEQLSQDVNIVRLTKIQPPGKSNEEIDTANHSPDIVTSKQINESGDSVALSEIEQSAEDKTEKDSPNDETCEQLNQDVNIVHSIETKPAAKGNVEEGTIRHSPDDLSFKQISESDDISATHKKQQPDCIEVNTKTDSSGADNKDEEILHANEMKRPTEDNMEIESSKSNNEDVAVKQTSKGENFVVSSEIKRPAVENTENEAPDDPNPNDKNDGSEDFKTAIRNNKKATIQNEIV